MAKGDNKLVKGRVDARAAYPLDLWLIVERDCDGLVELFLGLGNELQMSATPPRAKSDELK